MKVYHVIMERDGATTKSPGCVSTEVLREDFRYAADTMQQVWDEVEWLLRNDPERTLVAIIEEAPTIHVIGAKEGALIDRGRAEVTAGAASGSGCGIEDSIRRVSAYIEHAKPKLTDNLVGLVPALDSPSHRIELRLSDLRDVIGEIQRLHKCPPPSK